MCKSSPNYKRVTYISTSPKRVTYVHVLYSEEVRHGHMTSQKGYESH